MKNNYIIALLYFITLFSCTDMELEKSLQLAGNNRHELEKVLSYYRKDKQKLKAARFLIRNMNKHYFYDSDELTFYYNRLDSIFSLTSFHQRLSNEERRLLKEINKPTFRDAKKICDLEYITADLLIDNIDAAFEAWQSPYSKNMNFDDFCEYLLPYKSANERPVRWRTALRDSLAPYLTYYLDTTCNIDKGLVYHHESDGTGEDMADNKKRIRDMEEFTFTTWLKPYEHTSDSCIFDLELRNMESYANVCVTKTGQTELYPGREKNNIILNPNSIMPEKWTHFALSWSAGKVRVYINGKLYADKNPENNPVERKDNNCLKPEDPFFKGSFRDFRIYNRTLNIQEIYKLAEKDIEKEIPIVVQEIAEELRKLYANHKIIYNSWAYNGFTPHTLLHMKEGTCHDYSTLASYLFRSLGIGATIENTPIWANRSLGHEWSVVFDGEKMRNFSLTAIDTLGTHLKKRPEKKSKIYRQMYSTQKKSLAIKRGEEFIPDYFMNPFLKDVTDEALETKDISIRVTTLVSSELKYAYLCTFDNSKWIQAGWGERKGNNLKFEKVGKNVLYLPALYRKNGMESLADPFILSDEGEIISLRPDTSQKQTLILYRKYDNRHGNFNTAKLPSGRFEVANKADFSDSRIVHIIEELPHIRYNYVDLHGDNKYRYFRFVSRPGSYGGDIAEIDVYGKQGEKISGRIIGYEDSLPGYGLTNIFDGKPLTFYRANHPDLGEAGLDFGKPVHISRFRYLPRNDDNFIKEGDEYELYYWNNHWISLGTQKGTDKQYLEYSDAPSNAVFWLWNISKGKEERIFTYEQSEQIWW